MIEQIEYTKSERVFLWCLGAFGILGVNTAFLYGLLIQPEMMTEALKNPIALAFMTETMVLMLVFAYLLSKWGVAKLSWRWFVLLSLIGSMAFALPVTLLWSKPGRAEAEPEA